MRTMRAAVIREAGGPDVLKVEQRPVTLGPSIGPLVAVVKGVAESDRVITGNVQKIGPGMPVKAMEDPARPS